MKIIKINNITFEIERIENDINGNPRYKIYYIYGNIVRNIEDIYSNQNEAIKYMQNKIGGRKNKDYLIFQSYNLLNTLKTLFV